MTLELTGAFKLLLAILTILALALIAILGGSLKYWREKRKEKKDKTLEDSFYWRSGGVRH